MRIAQVAPLAESVPPQLYGGTERVVSWLTEELVRRGHEVTLFATGNSATDGELAPVWPRALRLSQPQVDPTIAQTVALELLARRAAEFDVLHCHCDWLHLPILTSDRRSLSHHAAWTAGPARASEAHCNFPPSAFRIHIRRSA